MAGSLSALQLQAAAGLFQNQGYIVNANLTANVTAYTSTALLTPLINAMLAAPGNLTANTQVLLQTFAGNVGNSCPALADSIVLGTVDIVPFSNTSPGMSGVITLTADAYMGNGDLSKFTQTFVQTNSYCSTVNSFINSAVNANSYLGPTFTGQDNLIASGLTEINLATAAMGDDLFNAGHYIDLGNLDNYGTPLALIQQISRRAGTISPLIATLSVAGVPDNIILNLNDPAVVVTDTIQKLMYNALLGVTGDELANILRILDVWTPNINTLADLLNPAVMLPNSYPSLTMPTADGPRAIYITPEPLPLEDNLTAEQSQAILDEEAAARAIDRPLACEIRQSENPVTAGSTASPITGDTSGNTGSGNQYTPNSLLEPIVAADQAGISYERLSVMTTPGLALANKALSCALDQVTNVSRMTLPQLAVAFLSAETNKGLTAIESQTQPLPTADVSYYANSIATGSGVNGTILLTDILGTAVGTNITVNLENSVTIINTLYDNGNINNALANLITIYNGIYANTIVSDEGNVGNLITAAQVEIGNIIAANPAETANLNTYFSAISAQITKETELQVKAGIDIGNVQGNSQPAIMSFVSALPGFGLETKVGGSAQYLELVANIDTSTTASSNATSAGQSTVAVLREGRTTTGLNVAGVGTAATTVDPIPSTPPPQAVLSSSKFSEREARLQVIY
jgi:hypothetical protein